MVPASAGSYPCGLVRFLNTVIPSKTNSVGEETTIFIVRPDRRPDYHLGHNKAHMRMSMCNLQPEANFMRDSTTSTYRGQEVAEIVDVVAEKGGTGLSSYEDQ